MEQPGTKLFLCKAQLWERSAEFEQDLLEDIPGLIVVTDIVTNEMEDLSVIAADKALKSALVTCNSLSHEDMISHRFWRAGMMDALLHAAPLFLLVTCSHYPSYTSNLPVRTRCLRNSQWRTRRARSLPPA